MHSLPVLRNSSESNFSLFYLILEVSFFNSYILCHIGGLVLFALGWIIIIFYMLRVFYSTHFILLFSCLSLPEILIIFITFCFFFMFSITSLTSIFPFAPFSYLSLPRNLNNISFISCSFSLEPILSFIYIVSFIFFIYILWYLLVSHSYVIPKLIRVCLFIYLFVYFYSLFISWVTPRITFLFFSCPFLYQRRNSVSHPLLCFLIPSRLTSSL